MIDENNLIEDLNSLNAINEHESHLIDEVFDIVNRQPKVGEWISVKDKLPDPFERVIVFAKYNDKKSKNMSICNDAITTNFRSKNGDWINMGLNYEIVAWMPLPKPYEG